MGWQVWARQRGARASGRPTSVEAPCAPPPRHAPCLCPGVAASNAAPAFGNAWAQCGAGRAGRGPFPPSASCPCAPAATSGGLQTCPSWPPARSSPPPSAHSPAPQDAATRAAADAAGAAVMAALNRNAVKLALPALFEAMADPKWQTKEAATRFLGFLATASPEQISVSAQVLLSGWLPGCTLEAPARPRVPACALTHPLPAPCPCPLRRSTCPRLCRS